MIQKLKKKVLAIAAVAVLFGSQSVFAYAFNPWVETTGDKTFAINPFVSTTFDGIDGPAPLSLDPVFAYGATDKFDFYLSAAGWFMPRYDLGGDFILAADMDATGIDPEIHWIPVKGKFRLETNIFYDAPFSDYGKGDIGAFIAPVVKLTDSFRVFTEVNPLYSLSAEEFTLDVNPGVAISGAGGDVAIALTIADITNDAELGLGLWYWKTFSTK